jgi:hypothetical protein
VTFLVADVGALSPPSARTTTALREALLAVFAETRAATGARQVTEKADMLRGKDEAGSVRGSGTCSAETFSYEYETAARQPQ